MAAGPPDQMAWIGLGGDGLGSYRVGGSVAMGRCWLWEAVVGGGAVVKAEQSRAEAEVQVGRRMVPRKKQKESRQTVCRLWVFSNRIKERVMNSPKTCC